MRRSFKLATVFTGAAALAGGYGPTALAATTHATAPDIGPWRQCGANNNNVSHWVHVYYPNNDHPAECIGGKGFTNAGATIVSFCPGNNNGTAYGSIPAAVPPSFAFPFIHGANRHGMMYWTHDLSTFYNLSGISISGWTGTAKCL